MKKNLLVAKIWVKFCMGYPDIREVIKWICEKTDNKFLYDHLYGKFCYWYDKSGSDGVMTRFYCELDSTMQSALVEYAIKVWGPKGMYSTYDELVALGGIPVLDKNGNEIHNGCLVHWTDPETKEVTDYAVYEEPTEEMVKLSNSYGECEALPSECEVF